MILLLILTNYVARKFRTLSDLAEHKATSANKIKSFMMNEKKNFQFQKFREKRITRAMCFF